MNTERILQELELEAQLVDRRAAELAEAIGLFKRLTGKPTDDTPPLQPKARKPRPARASNVDWPRARQQYENAGVRVSRIAEVFKVSQAAVYARIKAEAWKRKEEGDE